ncbi:helix-turn-helix transcriptional regulator [Rhizorhabdus dicambivorans]|nr:LuxR C-terminal-related transcriptional regulator [Rhizorhabdus dicambivorans]
MLDLTHLDRVRIRRAADIAPAAEALRAIADGMADWRVAALPSMTRCEPMRDAEGRPLASAVFGWEVGGDIWSGVLRRTLDSPLHVACRYESEPFWCNSEGFRTMAPNRLLDRIDLGSFERRSLVHAALVVPVHMPFGGIGAVAFIPRDPRQTDLAAEFATHADTLAAIVRPFITGYNRVTGDSLSLSTTDSLSRREVECLKWAALGKTDVEIGMIMSRSRATVRFHIHNAALKLNAANRNHTVFRAAQLGYIAMSA